MTRIPIDQKTWLELYPAVGSLILNWAIFESSIEKQVAIIYHDAGGGKLEPRLPKPYSAKIRFLRDCFNKLPTLSAFKAAGIQHLDRAAPLSKVRFTVTHGAISNFDPETKKVLFVRLDVDVKNSIHVAHEEWLSVDEILKAGHGMIQLARHSLTLGDRLIKAFP